MYDHITEVIDSLFVDADRHAEVLAAIEDALEAHREDRAAEGDLPAPPGSSTTVYVTRELTVYVDHDGIRVVHTEHGTWAQTYDDLPYFVMGNETSPLN